jgi:hypothetical protein
MTTYIVILWPNFFVVSCLGKHLRPPMLWHYYKTMCFLAPFCDYNDSIVESTSLKWLNNILFIHFEPPSKVGMSNLIRSINNLNHIKICYLHVNWPYQHDISATLKRLILVMT